MAEAALPEFDLAKRVGRKLALQRFRRSVVLCVVDAADFDGSLPRNALRALLPAAVRPCAILARGDSCCSLWKAWKDVETVPYITDCRAVLRLLCNVEVIHHSKSSTTINDQ